MSLAFSVILPVLNPRPSLVRALDSLSTQAIGQPFEVIVVHSGLGAMPQPLPDLQRLRIVRSEMPLRVGAARNLGLLHAVGRFVAFMSDDCVASPSWLASRFRRHLDGAPLVAGSVLNGLPDRYVPTAEYFLEYSALLPRVDVLQQQSIPHALSFDRLIFDWLGEYDEDVLTGEDTLFNARCIETGLVPAFEPEAGLLHYGSESIGRFVRHAFVHGRGLTQCVHRTGLQSAIGPFDQPPSSAALRMLVLYPLEGVRAKLKRLGFLSGRWPRGFAASLPLIVVGLIATGLGAWTEWRALQAGQR